MTTIAPLRCRCGAVRGIVDLTAGLHIVCYCDDCQAYARALGGDSALDHVGGTELWQTRPALLKLTAGHEHVRCLRLSGRGMLRWHTACCSTPIGNTMTSPYAPFVGVVHAFFDPDGLSPQQRDAALGPSARVQGRFAKGGVPPGAAATVTPALIARTVAFLAGGALRRAWRPTPFFDDHGAPVVAPRVLSAAERDALRSI